MEYTDKDYNIIDKKVYDVWSNKYKKGSPIKTYDGHHYKVIDVQNNHTTNGMQAFAVAPVHNKKVDYNHVTVAYAGTNVKELADVLTDIETIGLGSNKYVEPKVNQNIIKVAKWTSSPALVAISVSFQDADGQYHKSIVGEDELNVFVGWQITRAKLITRWDDNE